MIAIVFNPTAHGNKARHFLRELGGFGKSARLMPTRHARRRVLGLLHRTAVSPVR